MSVSEKKVFIVGACRTPIGNLNGALSTLPAAKLGTVAIKGALDRANVSPDKVSEVIMGQALTAAQGQNPSRQASMEAGLPKEVPSTSVNMLCGSGLRAVTLGYQAILCGDADVVVAGGQESMSQAPHAVQIRSGVKFGDTNLVDTMMKDGLVDAFHGYHMGITAENVVKQFGISREEQDRFAASSQNRTETSQKNGVFKDELVPVTIQTRKGPVVVECDEFPRHGTTQEALSKLKPAFVKNGNGTVTAGNASDTRIKQEKDLLTELKTTSAHVGHMNLITVALFCFHFAKASSAEDIQEASEAFGSQKFLGITAS